jgi:acyl-CoA thioesterase II
MAGFDDATRIEGADGHYRALLSPEWAVWGPMGGYLAAIALRALADASVHPRPATFACQFVRTGRFDAVEIEVESVRAGRRSEALRATVLQDGAPVLTASSWFVAEGLEGFEHVEAKPPAVPAPCDLRSFAELAENYDDWYPFWRQVEGRPARWELEPGPAVWHTWMRLLCGAPKDPVLDAARAVLWADLLPWNAAAARHDWPRRWIAPNLDLTVQFHAPAVGEDWILCDGEAPVAARGLVGTAGRLWTPGGRLVASATAQLFCVPNPRYDEELEARRRVEAQIRSAGV